MLLGSKQINVNHCHTQCNYQLASSVFQTGAIYLAPLKLQVFVMLSRYKSNRSAIAVARSSLGYSLPGRLPVRHLIHKDIGVTVGVFAVEVSRLTVESKVPAAGYKFRGTGKRIRFMTVR